MFQRARKVGVVPVGESSVNNEKTLVIHIGDHKTGSTAIQSALAKKEIILRGSQIDYPASLNHNYLIENLRILGKKGVEPKSKPGHPNFSSLSKALRNSKAQYFVLSAESLEQCDPDQFHELVLSNFAPYVDELRLVVYVRPHSGRILSTFAEQTKIGWHQGSLRALVRKSQKNGRFFYLPRLRKWKALFGESLVVRPFIRSELVNQSVIDDFASTAFSGTDWTAETGVPTNESLTLKDLMLVKHVQSHFQDLPKGARLGVGWELARSCGQLSADNRGGKLQLHQALAQEIHDAYLSDARAVDAEFFSGRKLLEEDLMKSVSKALPKAQSVNPKDYFSPDELRILSVLSESMKVMLMKEDKRPWAAYFREQRTANLQRGRK